MSEGPAEHPSHRRLDPCIEFYLNKEANELSEEAVIGTFSRWDDATHFNFVYAGRRRAGLRRDGKNTVSFMRKWPDNVPMGKVAYCRLWYDRKGNILESDIIFNLSIAKFTTLSTRKPDSYYIEGVLSHEIGHMIGLEHSRSPVSLMKPLSPPEESYFFGKIDEETLTLYHGLYQDMKR